MPGIKARDFDNANIILFYVKSFLVPNPFLS